MTGSFRRVLERHPDGMLEVFHWSAPDRQFAIEYQQDVSTTFTAVREEAMDTGGWNKDRDMQHVASVPVTAQLAMVKRYGPQVIKDTKFMRQVLDDPEWRYLRIAKVIV